MESLKPHKGFLVSLTIFTLFIALAETQSSDTLTAYELLEKFDFPKGILPEGVQSYLLRKDGSFDVYLGGECEFKVKGSYLLRYKKKISGQVKTGSLKNLRGVRVKILFIWLGIGEVVRREDELKFYVGPFSATFSVDSFTVSPQCRDGLILEA
ncbi:Uncharacterized protein AXF42_Ash002474 [Apostasia shenzhenica]|uniref:DUF538 domain-containing protein n=1 Tax=Apostasia shenzhenica TaxID=1088818 RepID=A0A2I0ANN0_9ASPA|nr:Uncharacterized protein AXF42_Ash002474 [Apostasia shenzhenica]